MVATAAKDKIKREPSQDFDAMYLSRVGDADFPEVGHKVVDIGHLYLHGIDLGHFAKDCFGHQKHRILQPNERKEDPIKCVILFRAFYFGAWIQLFFFLTWTEGEYEPV